jgi:hypothetical protein
MSTGQQGKPSSAQLPRDGLSGEENGPCIEYLQRAVAQLLMKNERMRFELFVVRQKIASIERIVFGAGSHVLEEQVPSLLLGALFDLCGGETVCGQPETAPPANTDAFLGYRSNNRSMRWMHQAENSVDRGKG